MTSQKCAQCHGGAFEVGPPPALDGLSKSREFPLTANRLDSGQNQLRDQHLEFVDVTGGSTQSTLIKRAVAGEGTWTF